MTVSLLNPTCRLQDCGRPVFATGLCQSHYKHKLKTGRPGKVMARREEDGTRVMWRGFKVDPELRDEVEEEARRQGISGAALIISILEDWSKRRR